MLFYAVKAKRQEWMRRTAQREIRLVDANIITGLQQATCGSVRGIAAEHPQPARPRRDQGRGG